MGGQLNLIPKLENYPGTIMSSGPLLAKTLESQYLMFKGDLEYSTVETVNETSDGGLTVKTNRGSILQRPLLLLQEKYQ